MHILRRRAARGLDLRSRVPAFLLGFLATSFQIYLLREFNAAFYGNELTFGFVLGAWLLWGGLGSLIRPKRAVDGTGLVRLYTLAIGLFLASLVLLRFSHRLMGLPPGQATGLTASLASSLLVGFLVSFPLGAAFVLNSLGLPGGTLRVYVLESLGAAVGGLGVHFLLVPRFSNWQGASIVSAAAAAALLFAVPRKRSAGLIAVALAASAGFGFLDSPAQKAAWRPLELVRSEDTPYGRLQVIRVGQQLSLYSNGLPLFTYPDAAAAEESVHFALLQLPRPRNVLLIGGGAGGALGEILKYPEARVDYVELDPAVIRLAEAVLPASGIADLRSPRVAIHLEDGRAFLERAPAASYDAVILDLPEPATAQINRFYTVEFFATVRAKLGPRGVLAFAVPSDENYIGRDLQRLLGSLLATLENVFPRVAVVPGGRNVFLASGAPLSIEAGWLSAAVSKLGLRNSFVSPGMLPARLNPLRVDYLMDKIRAGAGAGALNRDLVPVSYYFHSVFWAGQFKGPESRLLGLLARIPPFWVLDFPLMLAVPFLALAALRKRPSPYRFLVPVAVMGFTAIIAEMAVLIAFQAAFGCVYGKISLLLTSFMAGLFAGSAAGRRRKRAGPGDLAAVEAGFVIILLGVAAAVSAPVPEAVPYLALFAFGGLGGWLFIVANRLYLGESGHPGTGYAIDLIGSFLGVVLASSFVIPLLGIPALLGRLALLNLLGMLFAAALTLRKGANATVA